MERQWKRGLLDTVFAFAVPGDGDRIQQRIFKEKAVNDKSEDFWLGVAAFPAAVAAFCTGLILEGFVLSIMWGWFMVPFGLPHITVAWAIGVSVLTSLFQPTPRGKPSNSEFWFALTVKPLLILLIGWIAKQWM